MALEEVWHNRIVNVMLTDLVPKDPNEKRPKKQKDSGKHPITGKKLPKTKGKKKGEKIVEINPETGKEIELVTKVPKASAIKKQNILRHLQDTHKKDGKTLAISKACFRSDAQQFHFQIIFKNIFAQFYYGHQFENSSKKETNDSVMRMNQSFTIKTSTDLNPCYTMTNEELAFLYAFGECAIRTGTNPLLHLKIDRKTRKNNVEETAKALQNQFQDKLKSELNLIKTQKTVKKVISLTYGFDHAYCTPIKAHIGGFTMTATVLELMDDGKIDIESFALPIKTFDVHGKGDTTGERNAAEILKMMESIMDGEHKASCGLSGDGAIITPGFIKLMNEKYKEKIFPYFGTCLFPCLSHCTFLSWTHAVYLMMDDCDFSISTFFPNHTVYDGKNIFFFGDEFEKNTFCQFFKYWMTILKNLETQSTKTNIKLGDYILEIQAEFLKNEIRNKKKSYGAAADQQKFRAEINDMLKEKLSSADNIQYYKNKYFPKLHKQNEDDDQILKQSVVKVKNHPGKKSRRMLEMFEKLSKVPHFADTIVRNYFSDHIKKECQVPTASFTSSFLRKMAQFVVLQKYLLSINDTGAMAYNSSLYRNLLIVTKAAFHLDEDDSKFFPDILDNELIG